MSIKAFLNSKHIPYEVLSHEHAEGASRVAHALHLPGTQVAKTILLKVNHGCRDVVAVLPANRRIDPTAISKAFGGAEIKFGDINDVVHHCPDCERGVLPPFGSQYAMRTLVDSTLASEDHIVFECNTHDESIRMKWADFKHLESPLVVDFAVQEPVENAAT